MLCVCSHVYTHMYALIYTISFTVAFHLQTYLHQIFMKQGKKYLTTIRQ